MNAVDSLKQKFAPFVRTAWIPIPEVGDGSSLESHYFANALLPLGEPWPICGVCGEPMPLVLQLNHATFPDPVKLLTPRGLVQVFYCLGSCFDPRHRSNRLVRRIRPGTSLRAAKSPSLRQAGNFRSRIICGWRSVADFPHAADRPALGIEVDNGGFESILIDRVTGSGRCVREVLSEERDFDEWADENVRSAGLTRSNLEEVALVGAKVGDKLAGWPCWAQDARLPECPECGARMSFLFQISTRAEEDRWSRGYYDVFADSGTGHIFYCSDHVDRLEFRWACRL